MFEHQQDIALPSLAPICRNVPYDPELPTGPPPRPYQICADKLDDFEPVRGDRKILRVISVFVCATKGFMSVDQENVRSVHAEKMHRT